MKRVSTISELRHLVQGWKADRARIGLVPTMGNLHAGHMTLLSEARRHADRTVVSIFVNPIQFGPHEDFARYPRTLDEDLRRLEPAGADLVFHPDEAEMYPQGRAAATKVEVPGISEILCGASRPGHFRGVATVVAKLLNLVQPDVAVFGEKDLQQLVVIRRMVADLSMPVAIIGVPTVRADDGLALSSRNQYLDAPQRARASQVYRTLQWVAGRIRAGGADLAAVTAEAGERLAAAGLEPEYVAIRRAEDLAPPSGQGEALVVLAAARLGRTRLIDNLRI